MKIQIYTMQSVEEAQAVIALGVDHIGITPGEYGLPGEVDVATARAMVEAVGNSAVCVALSVDSDFDAICAMVRVVNPRILHLCGLENTLPPKEVCALRERLPGLAIIAVIRSLFFRFFSLLSGASPPIQHQQLLDSAYSAHASIRPVPLRSTE